MTTILFSLMLIVAIASIAVLAYAKGSARTTFMAVAVVAAGVMMFLLTHPHVL